MMETTPDNLSPAHLLQPFAPLSKGSSYPVFNKYPNFIVDYQVSSVCVCVCFYLFAS